MVRFGAGCEPRGWIPRGRSRRRLTTRPSPQLCTRWRCPAPSRPQQARSPPEYATMRPMAPTGGLRVRAARRAMVNAAFDVGLQGLGFLKGFIIAAFLTAGEYGI